MLPINEFREALARPDYSHTTFRRMSQVGPLYACVYRREPSSPTACELVCMRRMDEDTERAIDEAGRSVEPGGRRGAKS